jgi:type IV secretory pathway VirB10-like protein
MTRDLPPPERPPAQLRPPEAQSPVFRRADGLGARVSQPDSPWGLALGIAVCAVLGIIVFASLSNGRLAHAEAGRIAAQTPKTPVPMPRPAAAVVAPAAAVTTPPIARMPEAAPLPPLLSPAMDPTRRLHAPVMIVDLSEAGQAAPPPARAGEPELVVADTGRSAEERFSAQVVSGKVETSRATRLHNLSRVVPQGTMIPAVLETAINSDLPGSVRAVVSQDVRGFDGSQVLIPRGSKLIGQYRSGMAYGQTRAFVVWSRLLTPDGVSIDVGSPGTDPLGRGGLSGETDTHFFQRFSGAILLSVMSVGIEAASRQGPSTAIVIGSPDQASRLAGLVPKQNDIPVTIKVMQGTPLQVFLVRDLDFSGVALPRP